MSDRSKLRLGNLDLGSRLCAALLLTGSALGCLILFTMELSGGILVVLGAELASSYELSQLLAAVISTLQPVFVLLPLAFALAHRYGICAFWMKAALAPACLLVPVLCAALVKGGDVSMSWVWAMVLLTALHLNLCLWLMGMRRFFSIPMTLMLWGLAWACSAFFSYSTSYVLPYLEVSWAPALSWGALAFPPMNAGLSAVDALLMSQVWTPRVIAAATMQLIVLAILMKVFPVDRFRDRQSNRDPI